MTGGEYRAETSAARGAGGEYRAETSAARGARDQALRYAVRDAGVRPVEEFLIATRNRRADSDLQRSILAYTSPGALAEVGRLGLDSEPVRTKLAPGTLPGGLAEVLSRRRSRRAFTGAALTGEHLATVLSRATGVTGGADPGPLPARAAPSAGALYPVDTWVAAFNVTGVDRGVHRYLARDDELAHWSDDADALLEACVWGAHGIDLAKVPALLLFVATPWRSVRKYGPRGLRLALHETGSLAQNVHLAATALGLGSIDFTGFYDDEAHEALGIDGTDVTLLHMVALGPAS
ncbi:SagB/ThcOx family dehydrogenase [Actinomadura gamaensis]|uniref:SagB/ThcOx family dehydrogenase n=1 Tax=Actinomadura gamaensis TaxID=1763541 RepID=A0ABV9TY46_9ACTN